MRKFCSSLLLVAVMIPTLVFARAAVDVVNPAMKSIPRSTFFTWSVEVLDVQKITDCALPYKRVPIGWKSTLCVMQDRGVLELWKDKTDTGWLSQPITRGEALEVVTLLTDKNTDKDVSKFKDVKMEIEKRSASNALELKWMQPLRFNLFGFAKPLVGGEALILLQAATGQQSRSIIINLGDSGTQLSLPKSEILEAVWQILQREYLHKDKIDGEEATYKAIDGIIGSLNDPYTVFLRPTTANNYQTQLQGEITGIGAHIEEKTGGVIIIVSPIVGSPAERAGLKPGDEIIQVDGTPVTGIGLEKAVNLIRGQKGTTVTLTIRRSGSEMTVKIQRDVITIPEVVVNWSGDIAIVQLLQFGQTTNQKIRGVFADINKQHPKGIVLDLRNNPGGLLHAADIVVSNFVPRGTTVAQVKSRTETTLEKTEEEPTIDATVKVVVLVNEGSASASEIVAGALQDHKRAIIVGKKTFGKGSVQSIYAFKTGEAFKLTIAKYFTPNGNEVDGKGIKPNVPVEEDDRDIQLKRALDLLR